MNDQNKKYLWNLIQSTGDFLLNKLPDHPNHPKGRNPYAHVALKVKNEFGSSYKDIPDEKINDVINYLNSIKKNEGESNIKSKEKI
jgi:hypothetical protein